MSLWLSGGCCAGLRLGQGAFLAELVVEDMASSEDVDVML